MADKKANNCKIEYELRIWTAFYGLYNINTLNQKHYFQSDKHAYQIKELRLWPDYLFSIAGGFLLGVYSRVIRINQCDTTYHLISEHDRKLQDIEALSSYRKHHNKQITLIIRPNDKKIKGVVNKYERDQWEFETIESKMISDGKVRDILFMKNGTTLLGKLITQSAFIVRFYTESGEKRSIAKSDIKKIKLQTLEPVLKKSKVIKKIPTINIKSAIFPEDE